MSAEETFWRDGEAPSGRAILLSPIVPDPRGPGLMRRAWSWVVELSQRYRLETLVVSPVAWERPAWRFPGHLDLVHMAGPAKRRRKLIDWADPDARTAEYLGRLPGPPPDRLVVFRLQMHDVAALLPEAWRQGAELDCDDWEAATRLSIAAVLARRGRWSEARERFADGLRYLQFERRELASYKAVHLSAEEDVRRLRRIFGLRNVVPRPNKIAPLAAFAPRPLPANGKIVFFVGTLGYPPNEDAVRWIGSAVAPRLRRLRPDVEIIIAGLADDALEAFMAAHGLTYLHAPSDLTDAYARASVVVAPLRAGGGTKVKVLEAWQHGRPVVATRHAARGLGAEDGRHLIIADSAARIAAACGMLLAQRNRAAEIAATAARLLDAKFMLPPCQDSLR